MPTPITFLGDAFRNRIYIKHEGAFPLWLGGSKARKAQLFYADAKAKGSDCLVTYGGECSNLCRAAACMAAENGLKCVIIWHEGGPRDSSNSRLVIAAGAETVRCAPERAGETIDAVLARLKAEGHRPYFIPGGGHGLLGTQAYLECYDEIAAFERTSGVSFDCIFLPSGTGSTQAGLVCGRLLRGGKAEIVGISVARGKARGEAVVAQSVREYLTHAGADVPDEAVDAAVIFEDAYTGGGYGRGDFSGVCADAWRRYGLPLDPVYTGKAFYGMEDYLKRRGVTGKNVLFLHTGSVPLFFDGMAARRADG